MGLSHQLCIAHVRKYVKRRSKSMVEQAEREWGDQEQKYKKLEENLKRLKRILEDLPEEGGKRIGRMHREYLGARPPDPGGVVPEGLGAREAFVAPDDHFCELMVTDGLGEGSVAVQVGFCAVTTGAGTVGGASVDIGDDQAYLHGL